MLKRENKVSDKEIEKSKDFKNSRGVLKTKSLIYELCDITYIHCLYTLRDYDFTDHRTDRNLLSLKERYLEMEDPTEYSFAIRYFYNWSHWVKMQRNLKFAAVLSLWREELDLRLKCKGIEKQKELADIGNAQAAKWLAEKGYKVDAAYKGRPSKQKKIKDKAIEDRVLDEFEEDAERLGLKLVSNTK